MDITPEELKEYIKNNPIIRKDEKKNQKTFADVEGEDAEAEGADTGEGTD